MPLVEIIMGSKTSQQTLNTTTQFIKNIGKEYVIVRKDVPGFVVNRVLFAVNFTACTLVMGGEYTIVEVDSAVRYKAGLPMGIFELMDVVGIDVVRSTGLPCPLVSDLYRRGWYGQKTGRGFYEYKGGPYERPNIPREAGEKVDVVRILAPSVNFAAALIREDITTREDVDKGVKLGLGWPRGILEMADEWGIENIVRTLESLNAKYGVDFLFKPDPLLLKMVEEGRLGRGVGRGFYDY
jgi:enoyl-CoA hydratase/3-hydroxyacyl-CoA dehydrogenase